MFRKDLPSLFLISLAFAYHSLIELVKPKYVFGFNSNVNHDITSFT